MPNLITPNHGRVEQVPQTAHRLWRNIREATVDAQGNCHEPAGRPTGGQFTAKANCGSPTQKASPLATSGVASASALGGGVNTSVMVTLEDGTKAVYKPEVGEAWVGAFANQDISRYLTNRQLSLAEREAMGYEIDQMLGTNLVPETVLREKLGVDIESIEPGEGDEDYEDDRVDIDALRDEYDDYRLGAEEEARDAVGEEMGALFSDAQDEHLANVKNRFDEIVEIWNDLIDENPEYEDIDQYGSRTMRAEHPTLPLDTRGFQRGRVGGEVDPLEVIDEARVNVEAPLTDNERDRVRAVLDRALRSGAVDLLDVDEDRARDSLDYGEWLEGHFETEGRLLDARVQSFESWAADQGYDLEAGVQVKNPIRNRQAPHPDGGSLQKFVPGLSRWGDLSETPDAYYRFAVLDYALGSMDRHGGNVMFADGKAIAIDNGYSIPAYSEPTFRSHPVAEWTNTGRYTPDLRVTPEPFRQQTLARLAASDWDAYVASHPNMSANEQAAFLVRIENLRRALATPTGLWELWWRQSKM